MTNEEARELLKLDRKAYTIASPLELCLRTSQHVLFDNEEDKLREAIEMAIKALEQKSVLDKIRAEISDLDDADYDYEGYYKAITDAVKIIDKYKAERSD